VCNRDQLLTGCPTRVSAELKKLQNPGTVVVQELFHWEQGIRCSAKRDRGSQLLHAQESVPAKGSSMLNPNGRKTMTTSPFGGSWAAWCLQVLLPHACPVIPLIPETRQNLCLSPCLHYVCIKRWPKKPHSLWELHIAHPGIMNSWWQRPIK